MGKKTDMQLEETYAVLLDDYYALKTKHERLLEIHKALLSGYLIALQENEDEKENSW